MYVHSLALFVRRYSQNHSDARKKSAGLGPGETVKVPDTGRSEVQPNLFFSPTPRDVSINTLRTSDFTRLRQEDSSLHFTFRASPSHDWKHVAAVPQHDHLGFRAG